MTESINVLFTRQEKEEFSESLASLEQVLRTCVQSLQHLPPAQPKNAATCNKGPPLGGEVMVDQRKTTKEQVTVLVRIVFLKLGEIDTLRDRYSADVYVQAKWREPLLDSKRFAQDNDSLKLADFWSPKLFISNSLGELKEKVWLTLTFNDLGEAYIVQKRRMSGTFMEFMELHKFPFDTQDLTVSVTSARVEAEVTFEVDDVSASSLNVDSFVDEQEWRLHRKVVHWTRVREEALSTGKNQHHVFSVAAKATRRPEFFLWNIMTVQFLIVSLSFATYAVPITAPQNRLQLTLVLLLTTVSLKFVVNQSMPVIAYLTYLDKYILTCMAILCIICIWHSIVSVIHSTYGLQPAITSDRIVMATIAIFFVLLHFLVLVVVIRMVRSLSDGSDGAIEATQEDSSNRRRYDDDGASDEKSMPKMYRDVGDMKMVRSSNTADQVSAQQSLSTLN